MLSFYDTSTEPTEEMLEAMSRAKLGDDVYHDDPTVLELEALVAGLLGKDDAIFMPSGTMANLCAIMAATGRGDEVIAEAESHIVYYETGGMASLAGVMPRTIETDDGILTAERVAPYLRRPDQHYPHSAMLCVENTHNRAGGTVTDVATMSALGDLCASNSLHLHVDGARIFNAAVALGVDAKALVAPANSVSISLSKGLSAPIGAVLAGAHDFVARGRRARKLLGGSMRQAGVIAAAGIVALNTGIERLAEDHDRARRLAALLAEVPGLSVSPVVTNFVMINVRASGRNAKEVVDELKSHGIKSSARPPSTIRFVIHRQITDADLDRLTAVLRKVLA